MDKTIEGVATSIYTQLIHEGIGKRAADRLVFTIARAWEARGVDFDREEFENLALRGDTGATMLDAYLKEERRKSGDITMLSEPLSANQYEDALINRLRELGVSDFAILRGLKRGESADEQLTRKIKEIKDAS